MNIEYVSKHGAELVTLTNKAGLSVTLSDIGAGIRDLTYKGAPMMVSPESTDVYLGPNGGYYGKTVGPFAGRIKAGRYRVEGKEYRFPANEGKNALHSSCLDYSIRKFKMEVLRGEDGVSVVFSLLDEAANGVYPADISVLVRYKIMENEPVLRLKMMASPTADAPINLTNHSYWNPGAEHTILRDKLYVKASRVLCYDRELLPVEVKDVGEATDFRQAHAIGDFIASKELGKGKNAGYDHCFVFDESAKEEAVLRLEGSRFGLEISTDAPAIQIYSLNRPHADFPLSNGQKEIRHGGVALEPVKVAGPAETMIVKAGEEFICRACYRFFEIE